MSSARAARLSARATSTATTTIVPRARAWFSSDAGERATREVGNDADASVAWKSVLFIPSVVAFALGTWQLDRRAEKVRAIESRIEAGERVVRASDASVESGRAPERARTEVVGELELEKTARVGPRARVVRGVATSGSLIVTPVRLRAEGGRSGGWFGRRTAADGGRALLVRGWAPDAWTDASPSGGACVKTFGVARSSERRGTFTPENDPERDRWYWLDAAALAESRGLPRDVPLVHATREGGEDSQYPIQATREELMTFPVSPEKHMGYALTWFTLSGFTAALAAARMRRGRLVSGMI